MADEVGSGEGAEAAGAGKDGGQAGGRGTAAVPEEERSTSGQTTPEQTTPEQAAAEQPIAEQAGLEQAGLEQSTVEQKGREQTTAGQAGFEQSTVGQEGIGQTAAAQESLPAPVSPPPFRPRSVSESESELPAASAGAALELDRRKALLIGGAVVVVGGVAVAGVAAATGSGGSGHGTASPAGGPTGAGAGAKGGATAASSAPAVPLPTITTVPANGATGVDPSKPVTVRVMNGTIASVSLSGRQQTDGTLSTDGSSWTSSDVLHVDSGYRLSVTAKNSAGKAVSSTVAFQTLKPSASFGVDSVVPPRGSTVGVGQPIRVTFTDYVPSEYKAALEKACVVTTEPPVAGAWYWVSNDSGGAVVDWRPREFWAVNTKVSIAFNLDGVRLGEHQFGVKDYAPHDFTISDRDLRLMVDKDAFRATCYENGQAIKEFPIDTGMTTAETFVTYTGTMAVLGKGNPVEMKGNYGPGDTYDDFVNWATQITWTGTYVHAAPWDSEIGHANDDSHGCVHCHVADAEWFYNKVIDGDVVSITGSRARPVAVDNGICTFTLDWATLLRGSAYGPTLNGAPVSA